MPSISYQLYSSRNWDVDETFAMLSGLGVREVEGFGPYFQDVRKTRSLLDANSVAMPTAHFALTLAEETPDKVIEIAKALGIKAIIIPFLQPGDRPATLAGWKAFAVRLAEVQKPFRDAGFDFAWHNHDFELRPVEGAFPLDVIMSASDDIQLELDLAWVQVAGEDPIKWLDKYEGRILSVHVKDIAPKGENADEDGWADVGHGEMDWAVIDPAMVAARVPRYVIEHDNPNDHKRMASRSLATVQSFQGAAL